MIKVHTIGLYGKSEDMFFNGMLENNINVLIDIRRRRGLRGKEYYFANSNYLQIKLKQIGIEYLHLKELAPLEKTRLIQRASDRTNKINKSERNYLSNEFVEVYSKQLIDNQNLRLVVELLASNKNIALFCVEKDCQACHRSVVADFLHKRLKTVTINF